MSIISGVRRPKRSANHPKTNAPIGRHINVRVMEKATSATVRSNVVAMRVTTKVKSKKSNASSIHPRKLAMKVLRAAEVTRGVFAAGLRYVLGLELAELVGEGLGLAEGVGVLPGGSFAP